MFFKLLKKTSSSLFPVVHHCVITIQMLYMFLLSHHIHAMVLCVSVYNWYYFMFFPQVSQSDGEKKKKQKGKGTLEPNLSLPTKLATLKVLSSHYKSHHKSNKITTDAHTVFKLYVQNKRGIRKYSGDGQQETQQRLSSLMLQKALSLTQCVYSECAWLTASSASCSSFVAPVRAGQCTYMSS